MEENEKFATYKEFGKMLREVPTYALSMEIHLYMNLFRNLKNKRSLWSIEVHTMSILTHG